MGFLSQELLVAGTFLRIDMCHQGESILHGSGQNLVLLVENTSKTTCGEGMSGLLRRSIKL